MNPLSNVNEEYSIEKLGIIGINSEQINPQ
jgi:hypothetical protein